MGVDTAHTHIYNKPVTLNYCYIALVALILFTPSAVNKDG